ncbi:MAG: prepilin-type N-terminal cleavage/methylation domain-containing protein [Candidatus Magnetominusculus sp. LBB02]|nr:prepilin-type N-terminal cleavage/methylation domain-containing protein [Candidatus Magnetominusculus sp. LBB02]
MTLVNAYLNSSNTKGFTLVESMLSMLILMVVVLGMIQTIIYVNTINLRNDVRSEAVKIGQQDIDNQTRLVKPSVTLVNTIFSTTAPVQIVRHFNNRDITFYLCRYVAPRGNSMEVDITVIWQIGDTVGNAADPAGYNCFSTMANKAYTGSYKAQTIVSPLVGSS